MSSNLLCSFPGCNHSFQSYERFLLHMRRHVNFDIRGNTNFESVMANFNGNHCCTQCDFVNESDVLFGEHLRQHIFDSPYVCDLCDLGFKTIHDIKLHFKSNHPGLQLKFKVSESENVLNLIMGIIQRDNNVYFMMGAENYAVFMKADSSFWFIIIFASSDKIKVDKICFSKNMSNIVDRNVLERFPNGYIVSDKNTCIPNDLRSSIRKKSSSLLNAHHEHLQNPKRDIGSYKFTGSEFLCLSCNFVTKSRNTFSDHIWKDVHGSESSCLHRKVESCILDGKRICALVESTLYCLVFLLNGEEENIAINDQKLEVECFNAVKPDDLNDSDRRDKTGRDLISGKGQCPVSFSVKVNQFDDLSFWKHIDELDNNEPTNQKQSLDSSFNKHVAKSLASNNEIEMDAEETSTSKIHLPKGKINQFDLKLPYALGGNLSERMQTGQSSFLFLIECSSKKEHFELVHDTTPFTFVCKSCNYSCVSKRLFEFHKSSCLKQSDRSNYSCPRCLGSCGSLSSLLKHISFHLGSTLLCLYICCYCGKCFTDLDHIWNHLAKRHSGEYSMNSNAVKIVRKNIDFLQNVFKCFVCGSGHYWPSEYISHLKNSHKMFSLVRYLTKEFPEHDVENKMPTITFPKYLLSCEDDDVSLDKSSNDLSFETEAALDFIEDQDNDVDCSVVPMDH